jgi:cyclopropane fatty-acyl-phospholipid synthase-like methyltransferase
MPSELIRPRVAEYYSGRFAEHGATPRGVDWNSAESQGLRFDQIMRLVDAERSPSINDYGCGYGALAEHLAELGIEARLHGLDLSEAMVAAARERFPAHRWTMEASDLETADYTICSGIFNVKLDIGAEEWVEYVWETLDQMHSISSTGMIFNMLTSHADPERMRDDLFYADPSTWLDACMRRYGQGAALLHDYPLYEFTLLVKAGAR